MCFGKRKCPSHWFMSQTTRNSLSSLQLFRNSSDIPLSLTDRKQSISDKHLQWKNSDAQNVPMKGPSGKKKKTPK